MDSNPKFFWRILTFGLNREIAEAKGFKFIEEELGKEVRGAHN